MVRGRRPVEGSPRTEVLKCRLTATDSSDIEDVRGTETRSDFAREAIRDRVRARRAGK